MKKIATVFMILFFTSTAHAFIVGDIDFDKVDYFNPLARSTSGLFTINLHSYPDPVIQIVQVIGARNIHGEFGVIGVRYLKNDSLCVWRWDGERAEYRQVSAFPSQEKIDQTIKELKTARTLLGGAS